jgi:hypothetical protein
MPVDFLHAVMAVIFVGVWLFIGQLAHVRREPPRQSAVQDASDARL